MGLNRLRQRLSLGELVVVKFAPPVMAENNRQKVIKSFTLYQ